MKLIDKLNTKNPKILAEFKENLLLEKSKFDNRFSFFYEGIQRRNCQMLWMKNPEICLGCNL